MPFVSNGSVTVQSKDEGKAAAGDARAGYPEKMKRWLQSDESMEMTKFHVIALLVMGIMLALRTTTFCRGPTDRCRRLGRA